MSPVRSVGGIDQSGAGGGGGGSGGGASRCAWEPPVARSHPPAAPPPAGATRILSRREAAARASPVTAPALGTRPVPSPSRRRPVAARPTAPSTEPRRHRVSTAPPPPPRRLGREGAGAHRHRCRVAGRAAQVRRPPPSEPAERCHRQSPIRCRVVGVLYFRNSERC